jgi:8-oxo-dGTP pyrophosphatase MutT (NUDIX family)
MLAFRHPLAKLQFVKGTIDQGEHPGDAARRELYEESGLIATKDPVFIDKNDHMPDGHTWYFYLCAVEEPIPDEWNFETLDDGGHIFSFFWHSIDHDLDSSWHPLFHDVFGFLRPRLYELVRSN